MFESCFESLLFNTLIQTMPNVGAMVGGGGGRWRNQWRGLFNDVQSEEGCALKDFANYHQVIYADVILRIVGQ